MGKIMITGALGNVGGYVAKYCLQAKENVTVADINLQALQDKYGDHASIALFDFTKPSTFASALKDVDRVFIMRPPHLGKPEDIQPFIHSLQKMDNIRLVCFLSLIGVEHNPIPPHHKIEKLIEKANLPYCHIRPSFFMQNISGIHAFEIQQFHRIVVPVKNALTSFIDAEDIGELVSKILLEPEKHQNCGYSITGSEAIGYQQVATILSEKLNRKIIYTNPKPSFAKKYWISVRGLEKEYANIMGMLYLMTRLGAAKQVTSTFSQIMGKPPQSFPQFVQKNLSAWQ